MKIFSCLVNKLPDARVEKMNESFITLGYDARILFIENAGTRDSMSRSYLMPINIWTKCLPSKRFFQFFKYLEVLFRFSLTILKNRPDTLVLNDVSALPLVVIKLLIRKKIQIVYDSHEYWKEVNQTRYGKILGGIISLSERCFIKYVDITVTVSRSIADELMAIYRLRNCYVIKNYPRELDVELLSSQKKTVRTAADIGQEVVLCVFVGGMQLNRGIELLVDAMSDPTLSANIHLAFVGCDGFPSWVNSNHIKFKNISFHGRVNQSDLVHYISDADIGIHPIQPVDKNHYFCLPNKLFEYTCAGLCLLVSDMLELEAFVRQSNNGKVFAHNDSAELVGLLNYLNDNRSEMEVYKSNSTAKSTKLFWENQLGMIEEILQNND